MAETRLITRRFALKALPFLGVATAVPAAAAVHDPLLDEIRAYEAGLAAYRNAPDAVGELSAVEAEDAALAERTYMPAMRRLTAWSQPAMNRESALAALRCAKAEADIGWNELVFSMMTAALLHFETEVV